MFGRYRLFVSILICLVVATSFAFASLSWPSRTGDVRKYVRTDGRLSSRSTRFGVHEKQIIPSGISLPSADPFLGSRVLTLYGDSDIKNGFALDSFTADLVVSTEDGVHYTVAASADSQTDVLSLSMVRSGSRLSLSSRPQGSTIHSYMLVDGAVGAFLLIGQEIDDPEDISVRLATWASPKTVLGSELAGDWELTTSASALYARK